MHGPRYVAKGDIERGLGMSPMDLGDSPRKLGLMFKGWALLEKVVASTPSSNVISWVIRMVLALCG